MKAAASLLKKLAKLSEHDLNGLIKFADSKDFPQRERLHSWSDLLKLYRARPTEVLPNEKASSPDSDIEPNDQKQSKLNMHAKKKEAKKSPKSKKKSPNESKNKKSSKPELIRETGDKSHFDSSGVYS
jgi:hypothetical protein